MNITELIYDCLLKVNQVLFQWSRSSLRQTDEEVKYRAKKLSNKQYKTVLQEFVLLKTKYQVWTRALERKAETIEPQVFEVKVLTE